MLNDWEMKHKRGRIANRIFLSIMTFALISSAWAQQRLVRFQHIALSKSFTNRAILAITQDENGFLWFAELFGGLARYDGYEFKKYQHDPGNPNSIPTNEVHSLFASGGGRIWIGTDDVLVLLDSSICADLSQIWDKEILL